MAYVPLRRGAGRLFDENLNRMLRELYAGMDITQAENVVFSTYGDRVSVETKAKNLNKFGRSSNVDTGQPCTIAQFQGAAQYEETFVYTNVIDSVASANAGDTQAITIEGHTIDVATGDFTFVIQNVTLTGQTPVVLPTPLARVSRAYIRDSGTIGSPQSAFAGDVYIYDSSATAVAAGVPGTATATKMVLKAGTTQSQKCQTTISGTDYWFLTEAEFSITGGSPTAKVEFQLESRDASAGGAWRPIGPEISLETGGQTAYLLEFKPFAIVPKNHDFRGIAISSANNTEVSCNVQGYLAAVI